jgi:hypothetical protein
LRDVINGLLGLLGVRIENQHQKHGTVKTGSASAISRIFEADAKRQKYDHLNKPAPHRDSYGASEFNDYLRDGAAPPRRR